MTVVDRYALTEGGGVFDTQTREVMSPRAVLAGLNRIEALERELGYAIDALEGKPWTAWTTDTARDTLQGAQ